MNGVEFEKYIRTAILRLYSYIADVEHKQVIIKVDSGTGRTNLPMFARIYFFGLYIIPCVPNTSQVTQELDQNYVPFKSVHHKNLQTLLDYQFACKETLSMVDIPLIVFGGVLFNVIVLKGAFKERFSVKINLSVWKNVGSVPLIGLCLYSPLVRHQAVTDAKRVVDMTTNPLTAQGMDMEVHNNLCRNLLLAEGFDGNELRLELPKIKASATSVSTEPLSCERQDLIRKS